MELIKETRPVALSKVEATVIEQLCDGAWKTGGIRTPQDGQILESLRAKVAAAFSKVPEAKEVKK